MRFEPAGAKAIEEGNAGGNVRRLAATRQGRLIRFEGTSSYVATTDLKVAVNAAITFERPLLVKGEPGTGKTVLAIEIARSIGAPLARMAHQVDHQGAAGPLRI